MFIPESQNHDWIKPVTLKGKYVTLVPLLAEHATELGEALKDGELWNIWYLYLPKPNEILSAVNNYLSWQEAGNFIPFAVIDNRTSKVVGMTGYFKMFANIRRLDIGWTWYRKSAQKTNINTESKILLLTHAFEVLSATVVSFGVNWFNKNSKKAVERLGAKLDGVLRNHVRMPNGIICDYCMYSIIDREWPAIKNHLNTKLH